MDIPNIPYAEMPLKACRIVERNSGLVKCDADTRMATIERDTDTEFQNWVKSQSLSKDV